MAESVESKMTTVPLVRCSKRRNKFDYQFMNDIPDELLLEIFFRLPEAYMAIRCSSVCKRWFSLISSTSNPQFVPNFIHRHRDSPVSYVLGFQTNDLTYQVYSHGAKILLPSYDFLSFIPERGQKPRVLASCNDLLLVSTPPSLGYLMCNTTTKRWTRIPEPPSPGHPQSQLPNRYGLACGPDRVGFKVVLFLGSTSEFTVQIFSSDTGEWGGQTTVSSTSRKLCKPYFNRITAACDDESDGSTLHWLDAAGPLRGMFAYSPFNTETVCRYVGAPPWFKLSEKNISFTVGVFRGRLRAALASPEWLRICDLRRDWSWSLTHSIKLIIQKEPSYVFDFHPSEDDVAFLIRGSKVMSFKFRGQCKCQIVGTLPEEMQLAASKFSIRVPHWPTQLPSLTSYHCSMVII